MSRGSEILSFLSGSNALFLEQMYSSYVQDPASIDDSWREFFEQLNDTAPTVLKQALGATWSPRVGDKSLAYGRYAEETASFNQASASTSTPTIQASANQTNDLAETISQETLDTLKAQMLIRVYRVRGHLNANLDPLGLSHNDAHPELDPASYGFKADDYDREIYLGGSLGLERATLRHIIETLKRTYCGSIGVEFMHIQDPEQKSWIQHQIENPSYTLSAAERKQALESLTKAEEFEKFLAKKYPGAKRFGLEGGESTIPALETILAVSAQHQTEEVILGMAHRGRLNVLVNVMAKPYRKIFAEFSGSTSTNVNAVQGSGDVKYHLGASSDRMIAGRKVHLSLTANPSHLEAVNPVVVGKVRAKQMRLKDDARSKVLGILIHGDAAFAGQGLVSETLGMAELRGYKIGGTIHVVINNQIGFTTSPHFSRSSPYCSDVVKGIQAPVLHVNGDDVDAVIQAARMVAEFRAQFKKDIVLDIYCYRRHGHNEIDEPSFTQPLMYERIRSHPSALSLYGEHLVKQNVIDESERQAIANQFNDTLQGEFDAAKEQQMHSSDWLEGAWTGIQHSVDLRQLSITGASKADLEKVAQALVTYPESLAIHPRLEKLLEVKKQALAEGTHLDWATAEALAFGTLLLEGYPVRLSGQDCGRGTFSQRHVVMYDQKNAAPYVPLNNIIQDTTQRQREIEIVDSPLSEASVLGFELGYSLAEPNILVLWEAQFGDFANGAQVIIDQFISSGEAKWLRMSGLVLLLPHGYEGQGPEHSSARLERFLQQCAEDNMIVANCTTPANYFHILRRQILRDTRKPLIIMTPKSLLRHKRAVSSLQELQDKTYFRPVLGEQDPMIKTTQVKRIILCSGKVYYDLLDKRDQLKATEIALLRVEELYPFPHDFIVKEFNRYPQAETIIWCQEEPQNMGAWSYMDRRLENAIKASALTIPTRPEYVGRAAAASTATGSASTHQKQQEALVNQALQLSK
jgi:2-oxoglutarate dehydrogenase E1 component